MHYILLKGIFHAPTSYFDQTPSGRILSRFSKDMEVVDSKFPELLADLIYCALEVICFHITHFIIHLKEKMDTSVDSRFCFIMYAHKDLTQYLIEIFH